MRFLPFLVLLFSLKANAQYLKPGQWRGVIHYTEQDVPFTFEVSYPNGTTPRLTFINGQERRDMDQVKWRNDSVHVLLEPFDVELKASVTAMSMSGVYVKNYRNTSYPFSAEFGANRLRKKSVRPSTNLGKRWDMTFEEGTNSESKGVGLFKQIGGKVYGTIMTRTSDYRYFEGIMDGDSIKLTSFDGAHAFMILGKKVDGNWFGSFIFDEGYQEKWIAIPDDDVELEDPFEIVQLEKGKHKPYYDLLGAGSGKNVVNPANYLGKVLIIQLFGTWCPNSHDQTKYLVNWSETKMPEGVEILASSYEANYSQEYGLKRIEDYRKQNSIPYEVVLGGRLSKNAAAMPFPFMDRIEAFPTLVIVDKQGYARYVHSYFNGPATGTYYEMFDQRFNEIINKLISE